jgi:hypothetical protein
MIRDIYANSVTVGLAYVALATYIAERVYSGTNTLPDWVMIATAGWWFMAAFLLFADAAVRLVKRA